MAGNNGPARTAALRAAKDSLAQRYIHCATGAVAAAAATKRRPKRIPTTDPAENVRAVAIGHKITDGRLTGELAVRLYVAKKFPSEQVPESHALPASVDGIPTDVEESGYFTAFTALAPPAAAIDPKARRRPAQPGCSIGFQDPTGAIVMAGTFGAVVARDGTRFILSNNHVLADENALPVGSPIFQPGLLDRGDPATDQIAKLTQFVQLQTAAPNAVDCAIAEVLQAADVSTAILGGVAPAGVADAEHDMVVEKTGRTTGYTAGRVSDVAADVKVDYDLGTLTFTDQIFIVGLNGPFSGPGDSGSLIVERDTHRAVGLLFAGSPSQTIANHLGAVLQALGVTLA